MSIDRETMLIRLKALPDSRLSELIFTFRLDDTISSSAAPAERAMGLIRAVEATGSDAWKQLESLVEPSDPSSLSQRSEVRETDDLKSDSLEKWRTSTVEQFTQTFRSLRTDDAFHAVAEIMEFGPRCRSANRCGLESGFCGRLP
ncbi:MAG: hypothetical protein ACI93T_002042, partial [Porticoccaceae bacterium]